MYSNGIIELKLVEGGEGVMIEKQNELLWVVVKVQSGIPVMAEAYRNKQSAELQEQSLRMQMHPENDETGVFEISVENARGPTKTHL